MLIAGNITEALSLYRKAYKADPNVDKSVGNKGNLVNRSISSAIPAVSIPDIRLKATQLKAFHQKNIPDEILVRIFKFMVFLKTNSN